MSKNKLQIATLNKSKIADFAAERNNLLEKSNADWVFFVDSDEILSRRLLSEVKNNIKTQEYNAYFILRKNYFSGKYIGTDKIIRLARKNSGKWERRVHETWKIKGKVGVLRNPLIHETARNLNQYIDKINIYAKMHASVNMFEGKRSNIVKILIYPNVKFFQSLVTGRGIVFSILQAFHSFLSWSELWLIQKKQH